MTEHVGSEHLRRFARGEGTEEENRRVVAHLLGKCSQCGGIVQEVLRPEIPQDAYDEPFDRLLARSVSEQRLRSLALPFLGEL
jgi:hypothetical protein